MSFAEKLKSITNQAREDKMYNVELTDRFMEIFKNQCLKEASEGNRTACMEYCEAKNNQEDEKLFFFDQIPQYTTYNARKNGLVKCVEKRDYPIEKIKVILEKRLRDEGFVDIAVKTTAKFFAYRKRYWKKRVKAEVIEVTVHW